MSEPTERPVVRLRPGRRGRERAPWHYADEVVLDRRTRAIPAGAVVALEDAERRPLGAAAFNPGSKIALRLLDPDPAAAIDAGWFAARLARALALRAALFDAPFYRLAHAEADGLPGVIVDRFGDVAVVQPNAAWAEARLPALVEALMGVTGVATVVKNAGGRTRGLEGLDAEGAVFGAPLDGPVAVPMNGATYFADLAGGQKTGLFYDQRPNHAFAARLGRGRAVLDVFAHVGGFALAALAAGAASALAVDGSAAALELARRGARRRAGWRSGSRRGRPTPSTRWRRSRPRGGGSGSWSATRRPSRRTRRRWRRGFAPTSGWRGWGRRWSSRTASWCSARAATRPTSRGSARRACAGWRGPGGRRRSCTSAGPGRTIRCMPELPETAYLKALFLRLA